MKITWLGHASFLIETATASIVTDPFYESTGYRVPNVSADLVIMAGWLHPIPFRTRP